jgi:hypothetical protein
MDNLASEFLHHASTPKKDKVILWMFCQVCQGRTDHVLVDAPEKPRWEIYQCPDCGTRVEYKVR